MHDQTDIFAQLTHLHAQGVLTDAEYEAKKDALRGQQCEKNSRRPPKARGAFAALIVVAGLGVSGLLISQAWKSPNKALSPIVSDGDAIDAARAPVPISSTAWVFSAERDPMTDASYGQVLARFPGQHSDAEVLFRCGSDGSLSYTISTFDKDGQPAAMRMSEVAPTVIGQPFGSNQPYRPPRVSPGYLAINYEIRAGSDKSVALMNPRPAFNNQIELTGPLTTSTDELIFKVAGADTVKVRLQMPYGEETFQWPQAVEPFKSVAAPCILAQQSVQARDKASARAAAEQPQSLPFPN